MIEVTLKIEAALLGQVLAYLKTLDRVEVNIVSTKKKSKKAELEKQTEPQPSAAAPKRSAEELIKLAARPIRKGVTLEQIWLEQGSKVTDWEKIGRLAKEMDIQEPLEELLAQLTP